MNCDYLQRWRKRDILDVTKLALIEESSPTRQHAYPPRARCLAKEAFLSPSIKRVFRTFRPLLVLSRFSTTPFVASMLWQLLDRLSYTRYGVKRWVNTVYCGENSILEVRYAGQMEVNMTGTSESNENVHITFNDSQITAGRDVSVTGIQKETRIENVSDGALVAVGDDNILSPPDRDSLDLAMLLAEWQTNMEAKIDALTGVLAEDKEDLRDTIVKIKTEAAKAEQADPCRLERLLNSIAVMGPDIFEVAVTTLISPLKGIGLVLKKIGDKARLERQTQHA
jgi:hypothetical protein